MAGVLSLEHVSLASAGPTLSLNLAAGQILAVLSPADGLKQNFWRVACGLERPNRGRVEIGSAVGFASPSLPRRTRVQNWAQRFGRSATDVAEALTATRLWDVRGEYFGELPPGQVEAAKLLEPVLSGAPLLAFGGELDRLDLWTRRQVWHHLLLMVSRGVSLVIATDLPELVANSDSLVILKGGDIVFAGPPDELLRQSADHRIEVQTLEPSGIRALTDPFEVTVRSTESGLSISAADGQEIAARLLRDGYGNVKAILYRPPTLDEALARVIG